jgi:inhibitor of KinA
MHTVPLGDQALLAYCTDEPSAVRLAHSIRAANPSWLQDVVPAYASVGVFFNLHAIQIPEVQHWLADLSISESATNQSTVKHVIPVCYERQLDLARIAEQTHLNPDDVIRLHQSISYQVYAIGFVPGFPYLGYLSPELCGVGRLASPRLRVEPGSVGLTGRQTGIYPLARPGGWNILGQTPLTLVDVTDGYFPIRVGDCVQFSRIDEAEFRTLVGVRLPIPSSRS